MRKLIIIVSLVLFPSLVFAGSLGFRDIKMGMTKDELHKFVDASNCMPDSQGSFCTDKAKINDVNVDVYYSMNDKEVLDLIWLSFYNHFYDELKDALTEKYGRKYKCSQSVVQNRMGAKFMNEYCEWELKKGIVYIDKYGLDIEKGTIAIKDYSYFKRIKKKKQGKGF